MKKHSLIEPLEDRVAPATIVNPFTVTFQNFETNSNGQIQGDTAVIHISKPLFKNAGAANKLLIFTDTFGNQITNESYTGNAAAENLAQINLAGVSAAKGMNISVTVVPQVGVGQLSVNVGDINAGVAGSETFTNSIDLGSILIQGNLGGLTAGDHFASPSVTSINVQSMSGSEILLGPVPKLTIAHNMTGFFEVVGFQFGSIGTLKIGGSLTSDANGDAGTGIIETQGSIGSATIGNIIGGSVASDSGGNPVTNTGEILVVPPNGNPVSIGTLHILGSIQGGASEQSGVVSVSGGNIGKLIIDGSNIGGTTQSIMGGSGQQSGNVTATGSIGTIQLGGSLTGGAGAKSGLIATGTNIKSMLISGSIVGGSGSNSGFVSVQGTVAKAIVTGNITGGTAGTAFDTSNGTAAVQGFSGVLDANGAGSISIGGNIVGGTPVTSDTTLDGTPDQTADTSGVLLVNSVNSIFVGGSLIGNGGPTNGVIARSSSVASITQGAITQYGSIVIGGSLEGGAGTLSGGVFSNGTGFGSLKSIVVHGNIVGSSGVESGDISATNTLGTVMVGGNLTGGSADSAGEIFAGNAITSLQINGSVAGGSGTHTGFIGSGGSIGTLKIGGSLTGGTADFTGEIFATGALTKATILGNLLGNVAATPLNSTAAIVDTGYIQAGHIGSLGISGNVVAGVSSNGPIANSGAIRSATDITSLDIGGMVTGTAANPVFISAQQGPLNGATLKSDLAIGSIEVHGAATYLDVLAGYSPVVGTSSAPASTPLGTPTDGAAQINSLKFDMTLASSNLVAGANPDSGGFFGTSGNTAIAPRSGAFGLVSSIASIIVTKGATGDSTAGDSFGFVAENLGSIQVNGATVPTNTLIPGTPVAVDPGTGDNLFLLEPLAQ